MIIRHIQDHSMTKEVSETEWKKIDAIQKKNGIKTGWEIAPEAITTKKAKNTKSDQDGKNAIELSEDQREG